MCFNKEVSLLTFIISLVTSIKLFTTKKENEILENRYKATGILLFFIGLMQLNEYFLWLYQNPKNIEHQFFSLCIVITILLQAISFYSASKPFIENKEVSNMITIAFSITTITQILIIYTFLSGKLGNLKSVPSNKSCRINWDIFSKFGKLYPFIFNLSRITYLIVVFTASYYVIGEIITAVMIGIFFLCFLYYYVYYNYKYPNVTSGSGSAWCFITVVLSSVLFLFSDDILDNL